jgi:very-short-patch-repair endonuclease
VHHDELRRRLALKDTSAELFVKALEKVQGDERDTIVISCTYGPPEPGAPVAMSLGPIIQEGGHRRLNVLFTRAKRAIELVTSIESHQIKTTATSRQGLHAFRGYLKYVESQSLETGRPSGREPDSPFEVVVAEAIQHHGFDVDCQVGVANYFIDLAIRHPEQPDTYLLGVECDGATYHSARAARDRDKYRQSVLEGLGWQIYRIWSTDWFENAELETRKLMIHLEQILGKSTI